MSKDFYSIKELAQRYSIAVQTVRKLVKSGKLPAPLKIGHAARWKVSDIEAFENEKKVTA